MEYISSHNLLRLRWGEWDVTKFKNYLYSQLPFIWGTGGNWDIVFYEFPMRATGNNRNLPSSVTTYNFFLLADGFK